MFEKNVVIAAMCTGVFLLAETGLLDGRIATTNWQFIDVFRKNYPRVKLKPQLILTEDNGLICSAATTAFYYLCLSVIEKYGSRELISKCSKSLLLDQNKPLQSPYIIFHNRKNHQDDQVREAQNIMERNYSENVKIDTIAENVGISPRHFKRRFRAATGHSPLNYLQQLRIEIAKNNLEMTQDTIDSITYQVGYEDSNSFRKLFKRHTGLSPKQYRDKFQILPTSPFMRGTTEQTA